MEVAALTAFLTPFLPYLIRAGEQAAGRAADELGAEAWPFAKRLWGRLAGKVEEKPAARDAVEELAAHPQDEDAQAALRLQLRKLLEEDDELTRDLGSIWEEAQAAGAVSVTVVASGDRSIAIGGPASGTFSTGDAAAPSERERQ